MNGQEQKAHRVVTTEIALNLQALTEEWRDEFQAACDRLDLHQRQLDEAFKEGVAVRLELDKFAGLDTELRRLADLVAKLARSTGVIVAPLQRPTLRGRLRWLLRGI